MCIKEKEKKTFLVSLHLISHIKMLHAFLLLFIYGSVSFDCIKTYLCHSREYQFESCRCPAGHQPIALSRQPIDLLRLVHHMSDQINRFRCLVELLSVCCTKSNPLVTTSQKKKKEISSH